MDNSTKTLLIVEDDQVLNTIYRLYCEEVLRELPGLDATVEQAFSYSQAKKILQSRSVQFVSMDIALSREEEGRTDQQRVDQEVGGMTLLKELQAHEQQPLVVIVSGETLQSYAIDAYQEYGVLAFYQKDRFDNEAYKSAVKAALLWINAAELLEDFEIDAAVATWQQALEAAKIVGIKERNFESLGYRIQSLRNGLTHSVTGLPFSRWTENRLKRKVVGREDNWALIRVIIRGFEKFVSVFPSQEEPILSFVAGLLKQTRDTFQDKEIFIGHLGHREKVSEPTFVLVLSEKSVQRTAEIADWLKSKFMEIGSKPFTHDPALDEYQLKTPGQPVPAFTLELKTLPNQEYTYFPDLPFLLDTLGKAPLE